MGWDEAFDNQPADDQLKMLLDGEKASELYTESKEWIDAHPKEWSYMRYSAAIQFRSKGRCSIKKVIEDTRFEHCVSIKNALAPYFARWIIGSEPALADGFKMHKSLADGFDYGN